MMYKLYYSNQFKRQLKKLRYSGRRRIILELEKVINSLAQGEKLSDKYKNHKLTGNLKGSYECHIAPDWLLIYQIYEDVLVLELVAMGNHGNLFK
ncbi:MAG: type II toxin-antitoxin system YafQ family toxin [Candidatus Magasanikbacteria bacterium]